MAIDYEQLSLFEEELLEKTITKPIRLISFFSGIEAQYKALSFLGKSLQIPVESYKTCEWAYNSIVACNAIHNRNFTDYSEGKTKEEMIDAIRGISINYNEPLSDEQLAKKPLKWIQNAYNNCIANHNLINIMNVHACDLEIVDTDKYEYILTYSFPCQDLSLAGRRAGMSTSQSEEGGTRSGLLWEVERILAECENKPQILLMENVPQVHSEKDMPHFRKWLQRLEELGYTNYWEDLNAKNYGIPQNRERTFMVSLLRTDNGEEYNYKFPLAFKRDYVLKDFLETNVDERYFLSQKMIDYLTGINQNESKYDRGSRFESSLRMTNEDNIAGCITTAAGQRPTDNFIVEDVMYVGSTNGHQSGNVYDSKGVAPTLTACDYKSPPKLLLEDEGIKIREATLQGYKEAHEGDGVNISGRMQYQRGNVQEGMAQTLKTNMEVGVVVQDDSMITETEAKLFTEDGNVRRYIGSEQIDIFEDGDMATTTFPNGYGHGPRTHKGESITLNTIDRPVVKQNLRIRKLTPKEAGRLMAFQDIDTDRMVEVGLANAALYHVFGDSIVVSVLLAIFAKLVGLNNRETEIIVKQYINTIKAE